MNVSSARQSRGPKDGLSTRLMFLKIQLERISIAKTSNRKEC